MSTTITYATKTASASNRDRWAHIERVRVSRDADNVRVDTITPNNVFAAWIQIPVDGAIGLADALMFECGMKPCHRINAELLAACKQMLHVMEGEQEDESFDAVRAAIKRAESL